MFHKFNLFGYHVAPPTTAPVASENYFPGAMTKGLYKYKVSYGSSHGETTTSPVSNTIAVQYAVNLTQLPLIVDSNIVRRIIYRTKCDGNVFYKLREILDHNLTCITDREDDSQLVVEEPTINTAFSHNACSGWVEYQKPIIYSNQIVIAQAPNVPKVVLCAEHNTVTTPIDFAEVHLPEINDQYRGCRLVVSNVGESRLSVRGVDCRHIVLPGKIAEFIASRNKAAFNYNEFLDNDDISRIVWRRLDDIPKLSFIELNASEEATVSPGVGISFPTISQQSTYSVITKQANNRFVLGDAGTYEVIWSTGGKTAIFLNTTHQPRATTGHHLITTSQANVVLEIRNCDSVDLVVSANATLIIKQL